MQTKRRSLSSGTGKGPPFSKGKWYSSSPISPILWKAEKRSRIFSSSPLNAVRKAWAFSATKNSPCPKITAISCKTSCPRPRRPSSFPISTPTSTGWSCASAPISAGAGHQKFAGAAARLSAARRFGTERPAGIFHLENFLLLRSAGRNRAHPLRTSVRPIRAGRPLLPAALRQDLSLHLLPRKDGHEHLPHLSQAENGRIEKTYPHALHLFGNRGKAVFRFALPFQLRIQKICRHDPGRIQGEHQITPVSRAKARRRFPLPASAVPAAKPRPLCVGTGFFIRKSVHLRGFSTQSRCRYRRCCKRRQTISRRPLYIPADCSPPSLSRTIWKNRPIRPGRCP